MRVVHTEHPLPRWAKAWVGKKRFLAAVDMPFREGPKSLYVKLVLVRKQADLHFVGKKISELTLHNVSDLKKAAGFCTALFHIRQKFTKGRDQRPRMVVDPRYAAVLVLSLESLEEDRDRALEEDRDRALEIVAHECCHAALAWVVRWKRNPDWKIEDMDDEEDLCYPLGYLVRRVRGWLKEEGVEL